MKIAVRLDDITSDMDYEKFYKMKQILDTYQIKPLIGVVPFNEDKNLMQGPEHEDFPGFLQGLLIEGWSIALHGYEHLYSTDKGGLFPLNHFSEFADLPLEKQNAMIAIGKEQLVNWGIETDIFMAPAHSFDRNTLKALKKNDTLEMYLVAIKQEYQGFGLNSILMHDVTKCAIEDGIKFAETGPELETNMKVRSQWENYDAEIIRKRRCYIKKI